MIQKIIKKSSKINKKSRLGLALGALGGGLGAIWAPKAVWHGKKKPDDQKITASGLPFWSPFLTFSVNFQCLFCILFLVSILAAIKTDFSWILIFFLEQC